MRVTVRFTGMTQLAVGRFEEPFALPEDHTVADLLGAIQEKYGDKLRESLESQACVIHSGDISKTVPASKRDIVLKDGDIVIFLSHFAGG